MRRFQAILYLTCFVSMVIASGSQNTELEDERGHDSPLLQFHKDLVSIESITGNEHDVGKFLVSFLKTHNLTVSTQEVAHSSDLSPSTSSSKSRFNVHAYPGHSPKTRILVSSHIDTVPPYWPYERRNDGTEIWGRGSVDAKGSVAAQVTAFLELRAEGKIHDGDAALLFVVGEETRGLGMKTANDLGLAWEAVIFGEPTEGKLATGHKGIMGFKIKAHGKAAHSGYPWLGQSANDLLIPALVALENLKGRLPRSDKYGDSTINIGRIEGGVAANVVAEDAVAQVAVRLAAGTPQKSADIITDAIRKATQHLVGNGSSVEVEIVQPGYAPVDLDHDIDGFETITVNYGTDVPNLDGDHKRYLYGPGSIFVAHSDHEHLTVKDLEQAVRDYKKIIMSTLEQKSSAPVEL